jgi:hypothetical protein
VVGHRERDLVEGLARALAHLDVAAALERHAHRPKPRAAQRAEPRRAERRRGRPAADRRHDFHRQRVREVPELGREADGDGARRAVHREDAVARALVEVNRALVQFKVETEDFNFV